MASDCCNYLLLDDVSENRDLHPIQVRCFLCQQQHVRNININICMTSQKYVYQRQHLYHHHAQGNRLGFYEKLGEYEARPAYRW